MLFDRNIFLIIIKIKEIQSFNMYIIVKISFHFLTHPIQI